VTTNVITNLKPTGGKRHMTETYGDKSLRGVATKGTALYKILRLSHGPKWPVVLHYTGLRLCMEPAPSC
jgi:hypothetical protein